MRTKMPGLVTLALSCCLAHASPQQTATDASSSLQNIDMQRGSIGQTPDHWFVPPAVRASWRAILVEDATREDGRVVRIEPIRDNPEHFGNIMQSFDATPYRNTRIRFSAFVRVEGMDINPAINARLWVRVDRGGGMTAKRGFFDNMGANPVTSSTWQEYSIEGDVDADADSINIGIMHFTGGAVLVDNASFEVVGQAMRRKFSPPRPLTEQGLNNLVAFTKLLGHVRHFHPTDEAATLDWDRWTIAVIEDLEAARDNQSLAAALAGAFSDLGASIEVSTTPLLPWTEEQRAQMRAQHAGQPVLAWKHRGFGQAAKASQFNIYRSSRETDPQSVQLGDAGCEQLIDGLWCRVPIALATNQGKPEPGGRPNAAQAHIDSLDGFSGSGEDRRTRLAAIALAWNIFQHFYPYWDVVATDWNAVLRETLLRAATDKDEQEFLETLQRMVHHLHDGHGFAYHPSIQPTMQLPFDWDWAQGGQLVITHVPNPNIVSVRRGDRVLAIDGVPLEAAYEQIGLTISAATDGWRRHRALQAWSHGNIATMRLEMIKPDGTEYAAIVHRVPIGGGVDFQEPRIEKICELKPGVFYVDIDRISMDDYEAWKDRLTAAAAIIYDLRGYPRQVNPFFLYHHTDQPIRSGNWNIPVFTRPNQQDVQWESSFWPPSLFHPRWTSHVLYITGGGAISYAESCMAMVEEYKLGEIVGGNTAGTNGNVNPVQLPGGYGISWTGMKVTKHDGSQFHGVGIAPTVPSERTVAGIAAGRDEVLEKAIGLVQTDPE